MLFLLELLIDYLLCNRCNISDEGVNRHKNDGIWHFYIYCLPALCCSFRNHLMNFDHSNGRSYGMPPYGYIVPAFNYLLLLMRYEEKIGKESGRQLYS